MKVGDKIKLKVLERVWATDGFFYAVPAGTEGTILEPPNNQLEFNHQEMILVHFSPGVESYLFDPMGEVYEEVA